MISHSSLRAAALALACTTGLGLSAFAPRALAQDDGDDAGQPVVVEIAGPCALSLNGRPVACGRVAYMAFPANHRINFTVATSQAGWAFSGGEDDDEDGRYTLTLDSVLSARAGRIEAQGECDMDMADDRRTVRELDCRAATSAGELTLRASGVIAEDGGDTDDDDDGGDDDSGVV